MSFIVHYLDVRARGEAIRMILRYGNIPYQDDIISRQRWTSGAKQDKNIAPFGQVPSLSVPNGDIICETGAIVRLVAKLAGIYPNDPFEAAKADMIYELAIDLGGINPILNIFPVGSDKYQTAYDAYFQTLPYHLKNLGDLLGSQDFFGGKEKPHHGDFALFHILQSIQAVNGDILKDYPSLLAFLDRVKGIPAISEYLATRPKAHENGMPGSVIRSLQE